MIVNNSNSNADFGGCSNSSFNQHQRINFEAESCIVYRDVDSFPIRNDA